MAGQALGNGDLGQQQGLRWRLEPRKTKGSIKLALACRRGVGLRVGMENPASTACLPLGSFPFAAF